MGAEVLPDHQLTEHKLTGRTLKKAVRDQLGGGAGADAVIWSWQGSEIILHLDSIGVSVGSDRIRVRLDCETDQTGRVTQEVSVPLAGADLVLDGDERITARWGGALQDAIWAAVSGS